uniref:Uncharacterized protein n=1 Tax=Pieris rapae TaxID=64459 RepID=A0A220K8M7_PIERA|nr:hypothetical protein [Pieris rapae]
MIAYLFITYVSFIHLRTTECLPRVVYLIRSDNNDFTTDFKSDSWNFDGENDKNMFAKKNDFGKNRDLLDEIDSVKYSDVFGDGNTFRTEKTSNILNVFEEEKHQKDRDMVKNNVNRERKDLFVSNDLKYYEILPKTFDYNGGNVETKKDEFETDNDLLKKEYEFDNNIDDVIRVSKNIKTKSKNKGFVVDILDKDKLFFGKNLFKVIADIGNKLGKQIVKGIEYAVNSITDVTFQSVPKIVYEETKG